MFKDVWRSRVLSYRRVRGSVVYGIRECLCLYGRDEYMKRCAGDCESRCYRFLCWYVWICVGMRKLVCYMFLGCVGLLICLWFVYLFIRIFECLYIYIYCVDK